MRMNTEDAAYRQQLSEQGLESWEIEEKARARQKGIAEGHTEAALQSADRENGTSESVAAQQGELVASDEAEEKKPKSKKSDPKDGSITTDDLK